MRGDRTSETERGGRERESLPLARIILSGNCAEFNSPFLNPPQTERNYSRSSVRHAWQAAQFRRRIKSVARRHPADKGGYAFGAGRKNLISTFQPPIRREKV